MTALLYLIFVLSGAAGLMYESVWSRYLGLFVGHSAYAQIIVLVIFLGGMAIGAILVGRRSEKMREPLVWYAGIEIVGDRVPSPLELAKVSSDLVAMAFRRLPRRPTTG